LRLNDNQITALPENIGNLTNLTSLFLYSNQLTTLPKSIGDLTFLEDLLLSENHITALPENIGKLTNLRSLYLFSNSLTVLPISIGNLMYLEELVVSANQLITLPESIGNLINLKSLDIESNQLTALPESIGNLTILDDLYLERNQLISLPESIGNLSSLTYLNLSENQLSSLPESFGNLTNIDVLDVSGNQLSTLPAAFGISSLKFDYSEIETLPDTAGKNISSEYLRMYNSCSFNIFIKEQVKVMIDSVRLKTSELNNINDSLQYQSDSLKKLNQAIITGQKVLETNKIELEEVKIEKKEIKKENKILDSKNDTLQVIILIILIAVIGFIILFTKLRKKKNQLEATNKQLDEKKKQLEVSYQQLAGQKTELEEAYKKLKITQEELIQKEKDSFIANMVAGFAHDLRTPLSNIELNLDTLNAYSDLNKQFDNTIDTINFLQKQMHEQEELHTEIIESFIPIKDWVNGFQNVSRSQLEKEYTEFSLNGLFSELHQLNTMKLNANNILLNIKSEEDIYITSVKGLSSQIFQNIILNAIEHGFKGYVKKDKRIDVNITAEDEFVIVKINNNGRPIKEEDLNKIFDRYFSSVERVFRGEGLFLSKKNVETLYGSIEVSSDEKNGVMFTVTLPNNPPGIPEEE